MAYDKFKLAAYVHSAALAMPRDDTPMTLRIDKGVRAARGGNDTPEPTRGRWSRSPDAAACAFSDARMIVVDNARYEPEQILLMTSSSPVAERAFDGKVSVQLLPVRHPRQPKEDPQSVRVGRSERDRRRHPRRAVRAVGVNYVPSEEGGNTSHGFKFTAPVGRYLYVIVKDDVQGTGGYISAKPFVATRQGRAVPDGA